MMPQRETIPTLVPITGRKRNYRRVLIIILVPLILIEWAFDLVLQIWAVIHKSIESLTLALEKFIHEPDQSKPSD